MKRLALITVLYLLTAAVLCADGGWGSKALAEQGDASNQYNYGIVLYQGSSVPQDHAEALNWFRKAAEQGHDGAKVYLGLMYQEGTGVPQDYTKAVKWYRKAAEQGNGIAQNNLGAMYEDGKGVPQNYAEAYVWISLAVASGMPSFLEDSVIRRRDILAKKLSPEDLGAAQKRAAMLFEDIQQGK